MVISSELLRALLPYHCLFDPERELSDLMTVFAAAGATAFLELGTNQGATSAAVAHTFPHARVVTIDLPDPLRTRWNPLPRAHVGAAHRALQLGTRIEQRFMDSAELWRLAALGERYDVVFVDADHSTQAVFRDLVLAADLLTRPRGALIVHDYTDRDEAHRPDWTIGVQVAVDDFLAVRPFRKRRLAGLLLALELDSVETHELLRHQHDLSRQHEVLAALRD